MDADLDADAEAAASQILPIARAAFADVADLVSIAAETLPPLPSATPPEPTPEPVPTPFHLGAPGAITTSGAEQSDAARHSPAPPAAAALGGLALVWLLFEKMGAARALVALYFRVQPGELLEHERRERVIALVRERPGIGPSEIADDLGTGWGVTSYHLDRLERAGLVASQRVGHHRCYFLPGAVPRDQQRAVGLFRADTTRRVAELVAKRPGIGQSQLCQELGLSASAASKQLARLVATGLVRREGDRSGMRLFPEPSLVAAM